MNIMTIFVYLLFGSPVIYLIYLLIRLIIVDPIADTVGNYNYKKYHGCEELIHVTAYQNNNISTEDIMYIFLSQCKLHRQRYFLCKYKVFAGVGEQDYAWSVRTTKESYGWGSVTHIRFNFTNGWICFSTSSNDFSSGGERSSESSIYFNNYETRIEIAFSHLEKLLTSCRDEAVIMWKKHGKEAYSNLPFNFYSISDYTKSKKNEEYSSSEKYDNSTPPELIAFYRNLLGLKLHFSQEELKIAYREAIKKYHPDSYGSSSPRDRENAETLLKQINEANEFLKLSLKM